MANSLHASDENAKGTVKRFEAHSFADEEGAEYSGSSFGGFGEYFRNKKIKLQNKDAYIRETYKSENAPQLFKGTAVYVNGYTQPSLNDLNVMIVRHGGVFLQYLDGKTQVTHIIATALTPKKRVEFAKYKIVKPAWVVESIEAGVLLPWTNYRVVEEGQSQSLLGFGGFKTDSQTQSQGDGKVLSQSGRPGSSYRAFTGKPRSVATRFISRSTQDGPPSTSPSFGSSGEEATRTTSRRRQPSPLLEGDDEGREETDPPTLQEQHVLPDTSHSEEDEEETLRDPYLITPHGHSDRPPSDALRSSQDPFKDDDERLLARDSDTQMEDAPSTSPSESPNPSDGEPTGGEEYQYPPSPAHKKAKLTALENNTKLLSNPKIRQNTVLNPEFLTKYHSESRLHHLSQWKADLKAHFQSLTAQTARRAKPTTTSAATAHRYILHVDFDCFFASVSAKTRPELAGKPVAVGHSSGPSSEIASCNYTARESGVKNGMWMKQATDLCPDLVVLPYDFPAYEAASKAFYTVLLGVGATVVQSVSIDEALLDVTSVVVERAATTTATGREHDAVSELSTVIRDEVRARTGCEVSVGAGANVLLAKLALRKAKPGGQYHLTADEFDGFVAPLKVRDLPGVGYNISQKIQEDLGIESVGELRQVGKERLKRVMGPKTGEKLFEYARGIDRQDVGDVSVRKSVTVDVNWGVRFETTAQADEFMYNLAGELCRRLGLQSLRGSHLTLKLMKRAADAPLNPPKYLGHGQCDTFNKSTVLGAPTNDKEIIGKEMRSLLKTFSCPPEEIRGLGITMTKLVPLSESAAGSSQRKLEFGRSAGPAVDTMPPPPPVSNMPPPAPIMDKGKRRASPPSSGGSRTAATPSKGENRTAIKLSKPAMPSMLSQFLVPTQIDETVLESLPEDMREKIVEGQQRKQAQRAQAGTSSKAIAFTQLPAQSQLDPSVLEALPADIRAEILAEYEGRGGVAGGGSSNVSGSGEKTTGPQTPRKSRPATAIAGPSVVKPAAAGQNGAGDSGAGPSVRKDVDVEGPPEGTPPEALGIDPTFLAELPAEIRAEVIEQARAEKRRAETKAAALAAAKRSLARPAGGGGGGGGGSRLSGQQAGRVVAIPARKKSVLQGMGSLNEVRNLITTWHNSARAEGPHIDDVEDVVVWLRSVVRDDRDTDKAVGAVKWFEWVVGEAAGHVEWEVAVEMCKEGVREEAERRGMRGIDV